jgi:hypothetical protein
VPGFGMEFTEALRLNPNDAAPRQSLEALRGMGY